MQLMSAVTQERRSAPRHTRGVASEHARGSRRGARGHGGLARAKRSSRAETGTATWLGAGTGAELWLGGQRGLRGAGSRLGVGVGRGGASLLPAGTRGPGHTWSASSQGEVRPPRLPRPPACHRRLGPPSPTCGSALRHRSLSRGEGRGPGDWIPIRGLGPLGTCFKS